MAHLGQAKIEIRGLTKRFGEQLVLDGVSLDIPDGGTTVILGKSGEGKSVLLRHLIGLLRPDAGSVRVDGIEIFELDEHALNGVRRKFGMVFQDAALFDYMSVFDNVAFPLLEHTALDDAAVEERAMHKLELVGLADDAAKYPGQLSGGMRKRVGLARALVLDPEIVLYDEPTTGLDPLISEQIAALILDTQARLKLTSVVITHNLSTSFRIADKMALLSGGKIVTSGDVKDFQQSSHPLAREFLSKGAFGG